MRPALFSQNPEEMNQRALIVPESFYNPLEVTPEQRVLVLYDAFSLHREEDYVLGDIVFGAVSPEEINSLRARLDHKTNVSLADRIGYERILEESTVPDIPNNSRIDDYRVWQQTSTGLLIPKQYNGSFWEIQETIEMNNLMVSLISYASFCVPPK